MMMYVDNEWKEEVDIDRETAHEKLCMLNRNITEIIARISQSRPLK